MLLIWIIMGYHSKAMIWVEFLEKLSVTWRKINMIHKQHHWAAEEKPKVETHSHV